MDGRRDSYRPAGGGIDAGNAYFRIKQQFFAGPENALFKSQLSAPKVIYGRVDPQKVIESSRLQEFSSHGADSKRYAVLHQLALAVSQLTEEFRTSAFEETQIICVIHDPRGIGILVIYP